MKAPYIVNNKFDIKALIDRTISIHKETFNLSDSDRKKQTLNVSKECLLVKDFKIMFDLDEFLITEPLFYNLQVPAKNTIHGLTLFSKLGKPRVFLKINHDKTISIRDFNDATEDNFGIVTL